MSDSARDLSRDHASMTPDAHDSNTKPTGRRRFDPSTPRPIWHPKAKARRDMMRALGICINGSFVMPPQPPEPGKPPKVQGRPPTIAYRPVVQHGPVVKSGKCQRCIDVHHGREPSPVTMIGPTIAYPPVVYVLLKMPPPGTMRRRIAEMLTSGMTPQEVAAIEDVPRQNIHSAVRTARKFGELA